jgi:5'-phosphate synthase pdxT subunit
MAAEFGVLALQGDFAAHAAAFGDAGTRAREVRRISELDGLAGIMIPGGESTTLLNLMRDEPWFDALRAFHARGGVVAGTCAGAILLAREVRPAQPSLGLLDAVIERNAWGRQVDSFETTVDAPALGGPLEAVFIRAPRFRALFPEVEVLARHAGEPVLVRQGRVVAATFHPELTGSRALHRYLAAIAAAPALERGSLPAAQRDVLPARGGRKPAATSRRGAAVRHARSSTSSALACRTLSRRSKIHG